MPQTAFGQELHGAPTVSANGQSLQPFVQRKSPEMSVPTPHYVLFSAATTEDGDASPTVRRRGGGRWRFVLESLDSSTRLEAAEREYGIAGRRLELLAVVRGLEALDQPSRVTLVTPSEYVRHGLRFGVQQWRENGWRWEFFGRMVPIRDADLWRRLDQAMRIHDVRCRTLRCHAPEQTRPARSDHPAASRRQATRRRLMLRRWLGGAEARTRVATSLAGCVA
jgi:ribonuclease HI